MTTLAVRTAGANAQISMKARARHWEFSYSRLEDITPTVWDPFALVNDAAPPGDGQQICGTVLTLNTQDDIMLGDIEPGSVYHHNIRTVLTYDTGGEATWGPFEEGYSVYYDRSSTMPAGCFLSLSPLDENDVDNPLFGVVVLGPKEVVGDFPKGGTTAGQTLGTAVLQAGAGFGHSGVS